MKYLVTGAGGFIGRKLCAVLQENGNEVIAGLRHEEEGPWQQTLLLDLPNSTISPSCLSGVSCVFHLAGKAHAVSETSGDKQEYVSINREGTRQLLEASKLAGVRRFVYLSSIKVFGEGSEAVLDERVEPFPETPYGKSKLAAERLVLDGDYVAEPVVLRLSMVYGPSHKGNLPRMIEAIANGRFPSLPEVGNQRSMVHVEDVVQAALLAAEKSAAVGQTYIVTDGHTYSTRQIYEWTCKVFGKRVPPLTVPIRLLKVLAKVGDGIGHVCGRRFIFDTDALNKLIGSASYSSKKIEQELGFHPKWNLRSALPDIVSHLGLK